MIAIGHAPSLAPGRKEAAAETAPIRELSRALFEGSAARGKLVAGESDLGGALRAARPPDMAKPPEVGFVHRSLPSAEIYFLVNTSNHAVGGQAEFRVTGGEPAWWNPFTGAVTRAEGGSRIRLDLAPYESRVVVFSKDSLAARRAPSGPAPAPLDIGGGWKVSFAGSAQAVKMERLASWTETASHPLLLRPGDL